jgi:hypothetical protein
MTTHKPEKKLVNNIKMNLMEVCCEDKSCMAMAHDRIYISDFVQAMLNIQVLL